MRHFTRSLTASLTIGVGISACSSAPPPRTPAMSEIGVRQTTAEVRVLLSSYLRWFTTQVVATADAVVRNEDDLEIKESAIRLKIAAISSMQAAVFQRDPLAALVDSWALTLALVRFLENGDGRTLLGASQPAAVETVRQLEAEIRTLCNTVVGEKKMAEVTPLLEGWVQEHPIRDLTLGMRAAGTDPASTAAAAWGTSGLQAVAQIDETARELSDRFTVYAEQVPNQARWQGELLLIQSQHEYLAKQFADFEAVSRDITRIQADIDRFARFVLATPELVSSERSLLLSALEKERETVLGSVDRQRIDTLAVLESERETILASIEELRRASFADLGSETERSLARIDALRADTLQEFKAATDAAINHLFWRALQLVLVILAGVGLLLLLARRPRRRPESA